MTHRFLAIGEALVDVIETTLPREAPGGSPLNVAVTLGRLGDDVGLVCALADDRHGELLREHLRRSDVAVHPASARLGRTSTASARLGSDGAARYVFDVEWRLDEIAVEAAWLHTGSVGMFVAPGADAVEHIVRRTFAGARTVVSLDPNVRPALIPDADGARSRFDRMLRTAHVVKLSDEDARWLFDRDDDGVLDEILSRGPELAVITRGAEGAVLRSRAATVHVAAAPATVVDTIGAGDAFMGALLHALDAAGSAAGLLARMPLTAAQLDAAGRFAATVAGIVVARHGADPPRRAELG